MPFDIQMPDGTIIQDVPDGTTKSQIDAKYKSHIGEKSMGLGDMALSALKNTPSSAMSLLKNIAQPVMHPVDTAASLGNLGAGIVGQVTGADVGSRATDTAEAAENYLKNRYGGGENIKNTIATDPVGVAADFSGLVGGAGLLGKAGGLSKIGDSAIAASNMANPVLQGGKAVGALLEKAGPMAGKLAAEALGATTGVGSQSIKTAYGAGAAGGSKAQALADAMRGKTSISDVLDSANTGLQNLKVDRGNAYTAGMAGVNSDPAVLSLAPVDQAMSNASGINNFKGIDLSPETSAVRQKISDAVELWKSQSPADFHTAAGLDALKKRIGNIMDDIPYDQGANRKIAKAAYDAVKDTIVNQAPGYANTMADYAKASNQIDDIQKTLSLNPNASVDTSVRKLQSAMRDNVNTSFGRRQELAQALADNGAPDLMEKIAGQTLSAPHARGLGYALTGGEVSSIPVSLALGHPGAAAAVLPAMAMQSPRLVGEAALAAGKTARLAKMLNVDPKTAAQIALVADELGAQNKNQGATALAKMLSMGGN